MIFDSTPRTIKNTICLNDVNYIEKYFEHEFFICLLQIKLTVTDINILISFDKFFNLTTFFCFILKCLFRPEIYVY